MNTQRSTLNFQRPTKLVLLVLCAFAALRETGFAQTNLAQSVSAPTNAPTYQLSAVSDFQRLQYYYAAQPNSPAPGTERSVFTLNADRKWSGVWNSKIVPKPTRQQLDAIKTEQVDLFRRAGKFVDGTWQIVTSRTNIPLSALSVDAESYARLRALADIAEAERKLEQAEQALEALNPESR